MRNNETGEYELVVGNRQLLSGFFIVVLLCAAAFAMGYVVGENTHSAKPVETAQPGSAPKPMDAPSEAAAPDSGSASPALATPANPSPEPPHYYKGAVADNPPQPTTRPAPDVQRGSPPPPPKREREPAAEPASSAAPEAASGQYWQVTATTNRHSAETLVQTLKDKGFPATLSVGRDNLTHVLVGPYTDRVALGRAKTDLESNGFSQLVRK
jgi:cell division septation protein DedD